MRRVLALLAVIGLAAGTVVVVPTVVARARTEPRQFTVADVPRTDVGLVLGAQVHDNGDPSTYLQTRLDLAAELYHAGRVRVLVVSGASGPQSNHETRVMAESLVAAGVPGEAIVEDPRGLDTYASCWRARHVYGIEELTVVSQRWHVTRALLLCNGLGIDAYGVGDTRADARYPLNWAWQNIREFGAIIKAWANLAQGRTLPDTSPSSQVHEALDATG